MLFKRTWSQQVWEKKRVKMEKSCHQNEKTISISHPSELLLFQFQIGQTFLSDTRMSTTKIGRTIKINPFFTPDMLQWCHLNESEYYVILRRALRSFIMRHTWKTSTLAVRHRLLKNLYILMFWLIFPINLYEGSQKRTAATWRTLTCIMKHIPWTGIRI